MSKTISGEHLKDFLLKTFVQQDQYTHWLSALMRLSEELNKEYNRYYQQLYYVKLYQLMDEGLAYSKSVVESIKDESSYKSIWHSAIINSILSIKKMLPEEELDFIEYKRHNVCHIFQNGYEVVQNDGRIKQKKGDKNIKELGASLHRVLLKYGDDKGFDEYLTKKLYPILKELFERINAIHKEETAR